VTHQQAPQGACLLLANRLYSSKVQLVSPIIKSKNLYQNIIMKKLLIALPLMLNACAYEVDHYIPYGVNVPPAPRPYPNQHTHYYKQQPNYNYQPYFNNASRHENYEHHEHHDNGKHKGQHKNKHHDD